MLLVNVPNRMYPNYSKIFLLNLTQFNPVASPPENQKYILVHTTFFAFLPYNSNCTKQPDITIQGFKRQWPFLLLLRGVTLIIQILFLLSRVFVRYFNKKQTCMHFANKVLTFFTCKKHFFCVLNAACKKAQGNLF